MFFWIFENILVITPPQTATPELHSASGGLALPPRPIRTAALRRAGESTGVGAPPRRGGSAEIASRGRLAWPPAWRGIVNKYKPRPARGHCNQRIGCCSPVRCIALRTAALLYCTGWVRGWVVGGGWVVDGGSLVYVKLPK